MELAHLLPLLDDQPEIKKVLLNSWQASLPEYRKPQNYCRQGNGDTASLDRLFQQCLGL
jgi:hypothetical protein